MHVGYRLYREVVNFAPADLTSGELVVALIIADDAGEQTRRSWIKNEELCYRTRMKPSGVRDALGRLASRGLEFRVIHGYDKKGKPVYAARGHAVDYVVPDFFKAAAVAAPSEVPDGSEGEATAAPKTRAAGSKGAATASEGAATAAALSPKGAATAAPLSSENLNHLNIPSLDRPVITTSVEGARATGEVKIINFSSQIIQAGRESEPPPMLTQQQEFERQAAALREFEMNQLRNSND